MTPHTGYDRRSGGWVMCPVCGAHWWDVAGDPDPVNAYYDHFDATHTETEIQP